MPKLPEIFLDPWFRSICAVGFSLLRYRGDIFIQTDEEDGRDWLGVIELLEDECFSALKQGASSDPDYLVTRAREDFAKVAARFGEENLGLREVLSQFAEQLRPMTPQEIVASFKELNQRGLILTRECASTWGGQHAKDRAPKLKTYEMIFDEPADTLGKTPVCTWTDSSTRTIHLTVGGGKRPLVNFLCFEFYLLHEYLSHVLPTRDDGAGRLSEGYLFSVARWWYTKKVSHLDSAVVAVDWQEHWERNELEADADYWRRFHRRSDWFEAHSSKPWFAWLLLEVAAFRDSAKRGFQVRFLSFLKEVFKAGLGNEVEHVHKMPSLTVEEVHDQFKDVLLGRIDSNILKRTRL